MLLRYTTYHGTLWEKPYDPSMLDHFMVYDDICDQHNDLKAFYTTNSIETAALFSERHYFDSETQLQAILEIEATIERAYTVEVGPSGVITYENEHYSLDSQNDRLVLHNLLRAAGFQALVMKDHYREDYGNTSTASDDIAILDINCVKVLGAYLGSEREHAQSKNQARDFFENWMAGSPTPRKDGLPELHGDEWGYLDRADALSF